MFKAAGHEREARLVGIAKKDAQLKYLQTKAHQAGASSTRRIKWMKFTRATMRYGYEPWRVMYPIGAACLFGLFWFWGSYHFNYMVPSKEKVYLAPCYVGTEINCPNWVSHDRKIIGQIGAEPLLLPNEYPEFNSAYYALDTFFPIVDLHQEAYWSPRSKGIWGGIHRFVQWALIVLGWVFTTIAVAGFSGLIKKD